VGDIIAFGKAKGGVGNTTTAINLTYLRAMEKGSENVILVDSDSITKTASIWIGFRSANPELVPILTMQKTGDKDFVQAIKMLNDKYSDIIIDIGGGNDTELLATMVVANKLFIPARPSFIDTLAFYSLDQKVGQAQATLNPNLKAFIYPCVVSPNALMIKDDLQEIIELGEELENIKLTKNYIYDRKVFRRSPKFNGKTIFELTNNADEKGKILEKKDTAAEKELIEFYQEVYDR
jgi:chromosome partitioning protein